ncbi:hypothetical protein VNO77_21893 [Canavalia gladiata]|uniref:Uncharacterized protein n=1 Tax=Canavalia gladiata TaxID=3824 RepID=A0AAN9L465_CANGL
MKTGNHKACPGGVWTLDTGLYRTPTVTHSKQSCSPIMLFVPLPYEDLKNNVRPIRGLQILSTALFGEMNWGGKMKQDVMKHGKNKLVLD